MITEIHQVKVPDEYLRKGGLDPASGLFFDIETTGFRPKTSRLYLIGYAVWTSLGTWSVTQLFAEDRGEEKDLLVAFSQVCGKYRTVIHFNGDRFDLPYLEEKYRTYGLASPLAGMVSTDLLKKVRPYKGLLGLPRLNQKTVETFLAVQREDRFSGGELIGVYRAVSHGTSRDREGDLRKLLLHNYEDICGMLALTQLLAYPLVMKSIERGEVEWFDEDLVQGRTEAPLRKDRGLTLEFLLPAFLPRPLSLEHGGICLRLDGETGRIRIPAIEGTFRHFFEPAKDYYYLPDEDRAVHKSVGQFVDRAHRVQAKADTCYIKAEGRFLPLPEGMEVLSEDGPVFLLSRRGKARYLQWTEDLVRRVLLDRNFQTRYLSALVSALKKSYSKRWEEPESGLSQKSRQIAQDTGSEREDRR